MNTEASRVPLGGGWGALIWALSILPHVGWIRVIDVLTEDDAAPKSVEYTDLLENGLEDTGRRKGKLGQSERVACTYIHYQM